MYCSQVCYAGEKTKAALRATEEGKAVIVACDTHRNQLIFCGNITSTSVKVRVNQLQKKVPLFFSSLGFAVTKVVKLISVLFIEPVCF